MFVLLVGGGVGEGGGGENERERVDLFEVTVLTAPKQY